MSKSYSDEPFITVGEIFSHALDGVYSRRRAMSTTQVFAVMFGPPAGLSSIQNLRFKTAQGWTKYYVVEIERSLLLQLLLSKHIPIHEDGQYE